MSEGTVPAGPDMPPGHLAVPESGSPWPGIVVLHEAYLGLNDDIRGHTDRLASHGYLAFALDQYAPGRSFRCLVRVFRELRAQRGRAFDDIEGARRWLADREDCSGRVGVIGFCQGGGFALVAAARYGFAAAAVNYAVVPRNVAEILDGVCPIVASYGRRDRMLRGAAAKLERTLTDHGVPHDVKEYPDVGHSFLNRQDDVGFPLRVFGRVVGITGFREVEAEDAWKRILAFFSEHLSASSVTASGR